jgi:perosamine synthetase
MERGIILTAGPSISSRELAYTFDATENGWNLSHSCYIEKFERYFADYLGVNYAIATSSCTGALQIALMALDIGPGDEVIVPDMTWVATANAVRYVGATPIFADIEYDTWTLDAGAVEKLITNKTKVIIPAHLYGHPSNMAELVKISKKFNLHLIEDAAPAIGAEWEGRKCGTYGSFSAFSFQGAKLLVTGEGGMLVTNDESLYKKALKIWDQGRNPERQFWIDGDGVKFKMSNMQAAFGLAQIERVDEQIEMKRRIFSWYQEFLGGCKNITLNTEPSLGKSIYWMTSITINEGSGIERGDLIKHLKNNNIDSRIVFPSISKYPIWGRSVNPGVNAENVSLRGINLPSGVGRNKREIEYIASTIRKYVG